MITITIKGKIFRIIKGGNNGKIQMYSVRVSL